MIFLREYAAYIKDSMVAELCELNRNMMMSVDIIPVPTDEAVREVENRPVSYTHLDVYKRQPVMTVQKVFPITPKWYMTFPKHRQKKECSRRSRNLCVSLCRL